MVRLHGRSLSTACPVIGSENIQLELVFSGASRSGFMCSLIEIQVVLALHGSDIYIGTLVTMVWLSNTSSQRYSVCC